MLSLVPSMSWRETQDQSIWSSLSNFSNGEPFKGRLHLLLEDLLTFHRVVFCHCDKQVESNVTAKGLVHNTRLDST